MHEQSLDNNVPTFFQLPPFDSGSLAVVCRDRGLTIIGTEMYDKRLFNLKLSQNGPFCESLTDCSKRLGMVPFSLSKTLLTNQTLIVRS